MAAAAEPFLPLAPRADLSPLFPVQPWERDLQDEIDAEIEFGIPDGQLRDRAVAWIGTYVGNMDERRHWLASRVSNRSPDKNYWLVMDLVYSYPAVGSADWHFRIERLSDAELAYFMTDTASWVPHVLLQQVPVIRAGVATEQQRRVNRVAMIAQRNADGAARHVFGASGVYDHLTSYRPDGSLRMDRHSATIIGSQLSRFITQGPIQPGPNRENGPVRSNAVVLADLAQAVAAAALAAQANPAGAVDALVHFASDMGDLAESVAKKPRTQ